MTHTYKLTGMTCASCEEKVKSLLLGINHISDVIPSKENNTVKLTMTRHVSLETLAKVLPDRYAIASMPKKFEEEATKPWFQTYKPVLFIFGYISISTLLIQFFSQEFDLMEWLRHFMAGFFLTFSFFKMLNLKEFANSYRMYDIVAKKFFAWGYIYAFIELGLGLAFLLNLDPIITNSITFFVMSISIVGAIQTVTNKRKIQCACLGAVFDLPMSTITIIEDGLMILMSLAMLIYLY